jgi:hypothetical protein
MTTMKASGIQKLGQLIWAETSEISMTWMIHLILKESSQQGEEFRIIDSVMKKKGILSAKALKKPTMGSQGIREQTTCRARKIE